LIVSPKLKGYLDHFLLLMLKHHTTSMGRIRLIKPQTELLEVVASEGLKRTVPTLQGNSIFDNSPCGRAIRSKQTVIIEDLQADKHFKLRALPNARPEFDAIQATPIYSKRGKPLGTLSTFFPEPHRFTSKELYKANEIGGLISNVIEHFPLARM